MQYDVTKSDYYLYDESGVCGMISNGVPYYFRKNITGDVVAIYTATGSLVCRYVYNAWGEQRIYDGNGNTLEDDGVGVWSINPFRYRGYYWDREFGLYYLQSRYYDPVVGRFISPDDIEYLDPTTVGGLNLYAYCLNNPIMYTDETGNSVVLTLLFGFLIGGVLSGVAELDNQIRKNGWDLTTWDWKQVGLSALGGGVAGCISSIPGLGILGTVLAGGIGAVLGGLIGGDVTSMEEGINAFMLGAIANLIGYGVAKGIEQFKVNSIMKLSPKARSTEIWRMKGFDPKLMSKVSRYFYKDISREQVSKLVIQTNKWLRYGVQSSFVSSVLSLIGE